MDEKSKSNMFHIQTRRIKGICQSVLESWQGNEIHSLNDFCRLPLATRILLESPYVPPSKNRSDGVKEPARMGRDPEAPKNQEL